MRRLQTIFSYNPQQRRKKREHGGHEKIDASQHKEADRVVSPMDDEVGVSQRNREISGSDADHNYCGRQQSQGRDGYRSEYLHQAQFPAFPKSIQGSGSSFTPHRQPVFVKSLCVATAFALSACVAPQMHTEAQLNTVATGCGMALGELIQDEEQKKLLLAIRQSATPEQRACVAKWARRNGLKPVFVNMNFPESGS
jgi:hypothetical protein